MDEEEEKVDGELVDGELVDGELVDGGLVDGGLVDGGLVDGGLVDGGLVDGGLVDGGLVDGGLVDGGLVDGGLVDGGLVDGGLVDGGLVDGGLVEKVLMVSLEMSAVVTPAGTLKTLSTRQELRASSSLKARGVKRSGCWKVTCWVVVRRVSRMFSWFSWLPETSGSLESLVRSSFHGAPSSRPKPSTRTSKVLPPDTTTLSAKPFLHMSVRSRQTTVSLSNLSCGRL